MRFGIGSTNNTETTRAVLLLCRLTGKLTRIVFSDMKLNKRFLNKRNRLFKEVAMKQAPLFDVVFSATGKCVGKLRNDVTVTATSPFQTTNVLATDEGVFQGGEDTAPTPLEYFLTGLVGCLMTQIRVFSKKLQIPIDDVTVICNAHWQGVQDEVGPYQGNPVGLSLDIDVRSDEGSERIEDLVSAARRGCFVEQTLKQANNIAHRLRVNESDWTAI